jgi:glycerophosphoryl diester phosphodiesterase
MDMQTIKLTSIIIALMLSVFLASCKDNEEPYHEEPDTPVTVPYLRLMSEDGKTTVSGILQIGFSGLSQSFLVQSNEAWAIQIPESGQTWISVNPSHGEKDTPITFNIVKNNTDAQREATIDFTADGNVYTSVTVRQSFFSATADILDAVFAADGTAQDVSSRHNSISAYPSTSLFTTYNDTYQKYVARFHNTPGVNVSSGYYRMNYEGNNSVKNALAAGHSLEALFTLKSFPTTSVEVKVLSSMESGGTGLMLGTDKNITFLPHIGSGYVWNRSGIIPEPGRYYHVVGVYNKQEAKTYVYVDGELKATTNVSGDFNFPSSSAYHWFGIGADAGNPAQSAWQGDVAIARIYSNPLSSEEVAHLYEQVKDKPPVNSIAINNISYFSGINVVPGGKYAVHGSGYVSGDKIRFTPFLNSEGGTYTCDGNVSASNIILTLPGDFTGGTYRMAVLRGDRSYDLGNTTLTVTDNPPSTITIPKIICHRGFWNTAGSAENSIAALKKAQEIGAYGSEFDVWITTDGITVINHDGVIGGINIENNTYGAIKDKTLSNGEKIPTLAAYLEEGKKNTNTKLILEIKTHTTRENNNRVVDAVIQEVVNAGLENYVEYIAFDWENCKRILNQLPNAIVGYLNGDSSPQQLADEHIKVMDYQMDAWRNYSNYITQNRDLGILSNVWTVNTSSDMLWFVTLGIDFITTDYPLELKQLLEDYASMYE